MRSALSRRAWTLSLIFLVAMSALLGAISLSQETDTSRSPGRAPADLIPLTADDNLPSWNPNVECGAVRTTMPYILGPTYPEQEVNDTPYETAGTREDTGGPTGGVPLQRSLSPPCTITNVSGQILPAFVEIDGVYLTTWDAGAECETHFANYNGGGLYPGGQTICDSQGSMFALGTTEGLMQLEVDRDWLAKGYCGSGVASCDNVTIGEWVSSGTISLDVQGFVHWDGENWELHPATGVRLSTGLNVAVDSASMQTTRNDSAAATVRVYGTSTDPVSLGVSGCPADTVCSLAPASGPARFASTLRVNTTPTSPPGTFGLSITATSGSLTTTVPFQLTIGDRAVRTFRRGDGGAFSETDDLTISDGSPNTNFGADTELLVDAVGCNPPGGICKSLIKFPSIIGSASGQILPGSRIVNASLDLRITNSGVTQTAYQITEAWNEATATWNSFATPGVPGNRGPEFTFAPNRLGLFSLNITTIAQRWANGEMDQGILLASTNGNGVDYNSSETVRNRPSLKVQFVPPIPGAPILSYDMETLLDGRMRDLSGHGNHGTITGTADVAGQIGRAREFDGIDDTVFAVDSPSLDVHGSSITIAAWVRAPLQGEGTVVVKEDSFIVGVNGGRLMAAVETTAAGGWAWGGSQTVPLNVWAHIAFVYDGTSWKFYLDGLLRETIAPAGGQTGSIQPSDLPLEVGKRSRYSLPFKGTIDEFLVYDRALTDEEIAALAPPIPGAPILSYDMETLLDGRMRDLSGHGNHGTMTGTTNVVGQVGRAREFDGIDDIVLAADSPSLDVNGNSITIAAWVRAPLQGEGTVVVKEDSFIVGINGGRLMAAVETTTSGGWAWGGSQTVPLNEWAHIAFVYDGTSWKFYVNGVLRETIAPAGGQTGNIVPSDLPLEVGKRSRYSLPFKGTIDEVLVYDRALTDEEIAALVPPIPGAPILSYDMETLLDGRMRDLSGNGRHGTLTGTTDVLGKVGRARHFDAGARITAAPIAVPGSDFTVAAWFKWTTNPSPYYSGIHGGGGSWELRVMADGRFGATFYQSIGPDVFTETVSALAYNDGEWHHAVGVLRNGLAEIYVDGALRAADTTNPVTSILTSTQTVVGQVASDFVGDIDEVRVFSSALTDGEIAALVSGTAVDIQFSSANLPSGTSHTFMPGSCDPTCSTPSGTNAMAITMSEISVSGRATSSITVLSATIGMFPRREPGPHQ